MTAMVRRLVRWWRQWLSDEPGGMNRAPGRLRALGRQLAAWVSRHPTAVDAALAVVLAAGTVPQLTHIARYQSGEFGEYVLFSALLVVPLIWRRRFPLSAFAFVAVIAFIHWIADVRLAADVILLVCLYTVASRYPLRAGLLATAVVEVGTVLAALRWPLTRLWFETVVLLSGLVAASLLLGLSMRHRRNSLRALTQRAEQLERERDQQAVIAASAERTRIAGEMHDVVAHSLAVMVTLSEGAVLKQAAEPDRATAAMRQVSATGHQALDEMRRLLGVLRTEDSGESAGSRQPQPGLAQLGGLLDQVRATGLAAELTVTGTPGGLTPGAELAVYRIVQEALTNTLKHAAGPSRVTVAIGYEPDSVLVRVHDDGADADTGARFRPGQAPGHGLAGMKERAAVYGGTVSAGPDPAGGWQISACLRRSPR
jgi:signal transduction histidine kinase